ncbi:YkyA family protein, partial [Staphylococcus epidermidis]|uniref:YkyA family protein n=1 Tax=Staphylococcus epidermidis TaxID=1282 RepID=UPI0016431C01
KQKYKSHDPYTNPYKKPLNKQKQLFSYFNQHNPTQSQLHPKSKHLSKPYKQINNKFNPYSKPIDKLKTQKQH